jgi:DNA-binding protein HU-beta
MTTDTLVTTLAEKAGCTKRDATKVFSLVIETIKEALEAGETVKLYGVATLSVKDQTCRVSGPLTPYVKGVRKVPRAKFSNKLKQVLNQ